MLRECLTEGGSPAGKQCAVGLGDGDWKAAHWMKFLYKNLDQATPFSAKRILSFPLAGTGAILREKTRKHNFKQL